MINLLDAELNIFSLIIVLLFYFNQRRSGSYAMDDRVFNGLLVVAMFLLLVDTSLWLLDGVLYPGSRWVLLGLTTLEFMVIPLAGLLWLVYCDLSVYADERGMRRRGWLYALPVLVSLPILLVNLGIPVFFSIDSASTYHREPLFFVFETLLYLYLGWSVALLWKKGCDSQSPMECREHRTLLLFSVPMFIGGTLQLLFYGVSLLWPSLTISIVFVYTHMLSRQISTDPLTGLNNRRKLRRFLELKISSAVEDSLLYVIMMDADAFKQINDQFGHAAGDRAIIAIAEVLKSLPCNHSCFIARLGGDEFVLIGTDPDGAQADRIIRLIQAGVEAFNATTKEPFRLSLSIGLARYQAHEIRTADALLTAADRAMYRIKEQRRQDACARL